MEQRLNLNHLALFAKVAELGSFTAAAVYLKIPKSKASRGIADLESELKAPLFFRNTRHIELTPFGRDLFAGCFSGFSALELSVRTALVKSRLPARRIRITAVEDMGATLVADAIATFSAKYPQMSFELVLTNEQLDLVRLGIDIAVRVGKLRHKSHFKRRLGSVRFILVASIRFCERHSPNLTLEGLSGYPLMALPSFALAQKSLQLHNGDWSVDLKMTSLAEAANSLALLNMVKGDMGIGLLPDFICRRDIDHGSLRQICPGWHTQTMEVSLVFSRTLRTDSILKEFGECLFERMHSHLS